MPGTRIECFLKIDDDNFRCCAEHVFLGTNAGGTVHVSETNNACIMMACLSGTARVQPLIRVERLARYAASLFGRQSGTHCRFQPFCCFVHADPAQFAYQPRPIVRYLLGRSRCNLRVCRFH